MSSLTRAFCNNKKLNQALKNTRELVSATSQIMAYSLVFSHLTFIPYVHAGPAGGNVVGGSGTINHSGLTTNINQLTPAMAIDWNSYNVNANEIVNYIQPDASSISLNRILGNSASQIHGQINANGQVVLVNTNGIFFSPTASVNVGGLLASGLNIDPVDFMNGEYVFSSIDADNGAIINSGILNASLGGSISLLGKQVTNNGLISANLGAVNLAAGKEAVLTFDNQGLMGIKISREILQDELGVDPAVLNNGEITAEGGRVLLTASQSQDIFSQAVNSNGIEQATSVVVNADGSFTLGSGADVVNTGAVDVSTTDNNAGKVVMLGENVTSSGVVKADSINANGGEVELHATGTTLLTENSTTTARSENNGEGGQVKVLGDRVGLFDQSTVDVSGENGGGQALIGGDFQGKNQAIKNASFSYISDNVQIKANAGNLGNGGKVIVWADNTTRYYGDIQAKGGSQEGNGGFAEVSGKGALDFNGFADLSSTMGEAGMLLLDPLNITIQDGGNDNVGDNNAFDENPDDNKVFDATQIQDIINGGTDLTLQANQDIWVNEAITTTGSNNLTLEAGDDIQIDENITLGSGDIGIISSDGNCDPCDQGGVAPDEATISGRNIFLNANLVTTGGSITLNGDNIGVIGTGASATRELNSGGGGIDITGRVLGTSAADSNSLTLTAGAGTITFNGDIGNDLSDNISGLKIVSANIVNLERVRTGSGLADSFGIDIKATTINLNNLLDTSLDATPGKIKLDGAVFLENNIAVTTGNGSTFNITGALNSLTGNTSGLTITAGNGSVDFDSEIGNGTDQRLGLFRIISSGAITLGTSAGVGGLEADSVNIEQSTSFENYGFNIDTFGVGNSAGGTVGITSATKLNVGDINSIGGTVSGNNNGVAGGAVNLTAAEIAVKNIVTTGGDASGNNRSGGAGGLITLNAIKNAGFQSITINNDLSSLGGFDTNNSGSTTTRNTSPSVIVGLSNAGGSPGGVVNLRNTTNAFTSDVVITGSSGTDTLSAANKTNTWNITGNASGNNSQGDLNSNISFVDFENLTGGTELDTFSFTYTDATEFGAIDGLIDGGTSGGAFFDSINLYTAGGATVNTSVQFGAASGAAGNGVSSGFLEINDIETITANANNTNNLTGPDSSINWFINGAGSGSVGGNVLTPSPAEGETIFRGFNTLTGGNLADTFNIVSNDLLTDLMIVNGGASATNTAVDNDILISVNVDSDWVFTDITNGTLKDNDADNGTNLNIEFNGVEVLTAGTGTDSLTGFSNDNTWTISDNGNSETGSGTFKDTSDAGAAVVTTFSNMENLIGGGLVDIFNIQGTANITGNINGGADADTFNILAANVTLTLDGGDAVSNDTLLAFNVENTWTIDGSATQLLVATAGGTVTFNQIENLTGGNLKDTFNFSGAGAASIVNGGGGTTNTIKGKDVNNAWQLIAANEGNVADITIPASPVTYISSFIDIQTLTGGTGADTLTGRNANSTWTIDNPNAGFVAESIISPTDTVTFTSIENLIGNDTANDSFVFSISGALAGTIEGGTGGADSITLDIVDGALNTWVITGPDSGRLVGVIYTDDATGLLNGFTGIEGVKGSDDDDKFVIENANYMTNINGGNTDNVLTDPNDEVDFSGLGGASISVQLGPLGFSNIEVLGGNDTDSTLIGDNTLANNTWEITGPNSGTVNGTIKFTGFNTLIGSANADDSFEFSLLGALSGTIEGGAGGADSITYNIVDGALNTWAITGPESGRLVGVINTSDITDLLDGFTGIEGVKGSDDDDRFVIENSNYMTNINGGNDDNVLTDPNDEVDFSGLGAGPLSIQLGPSSFSNIDILGGNGVSSTLIGDDSLSDNVWNITDTNSGTVNGTLSFTGFNNLQGGDSSNDTFNFIDNAGVQGNITGLIDGGSGAGTDILNIFTPTNLLFDGIGAAVTVQLEGVLNDNLNGFIDVINLTDIEANIGFTNILRGGETLNTWTIDGTQSGSVITSTTTGFTNFDSLIGGDAAVDTFRIDDLGVIANIEGGVTSGVIDEIINQRTAATTWGISADSEGSVTGITKFIGIEKLSGADDVVDTFNVGENAVISDSINGGTGGVDEIVSQRTSATNWTINADSRGNVNGITLFTGFEKLSGADDVVDTFNVGENAVISDSINGGTGGVDEIVSQRTSATSWNISADSEGNVNGITLFRGIEKLSGADDIVDNFYLTNNGIISDSINGGAGLVVDEIVNQRTLGTTWNITDLNLGNVTGISSFVGIEKITGGGANDNFVLDGGTIDGTIDGGLGGIDTIKGDFENNTWTLSDIKDGNVIGDTTAITLNFTEIEKLIGNDLDDEFTFSATAALGMIIDGAGELRDIIGDLVGEGDVVDISALPEVPALDIVLGVTFSDVEKIIANNLDATLTGLDLDNTWEIRDLGDPGIAYSENQGTVTDINGDVVTFAGFNNITGGNQDDDFILRTSGSITGVIDGGVGTGIDSINLSEQTVVDETVVNSASDQPGFANIDGITGNGTQSILRAGDNGSLWTITGNNEGFVKNDDGTQTTFFFDFNILQGGDGTDVFVVESGGSIGNQTPADLVSRINGGAGIDELTVNLSGTASQRISLFDGEGTTSKDDLITFNTADPSADNRVTINSVTTGFDLANYTTNYNGQNVTHEYSNTGNSIVSAVSYVRVEGVNSNNVNENVVAGNLVINGSGNTNTVTLGLSNGGSGGFLIENGATIGSGTASSSVLYQNKGGLSARNLGDVSRIELFGNLNFTGPNSLVDLSATTINLLNTAFVISAQKLRLDSVENINTSNSGSRLMTNIAELELNNITTDLFIQEADGLGLQQADTTAILDILSSIGNITDLANLTASGNIKLTTTTGDILLNNTNTLSGNISLITAVGRTATLVNTGSTTLDEVTVGNLNITSSGVLSDVGTVTVADKTVLNSNASAIILNNGNNNFNVVEITTNSLAEIADQNSIIFDNVSLGEGAFKVTANGVTQLANTAITQTTTGAAGDITIDAGAGIINLSNASNEFIGNVYLQNSGNNNVSITDISKISFDNSSIGWGEFTVNAIGIEQRAGTSVVQASNTGSPTGTAGNVVLNAGAGVIDLNEAANDFSGVVFLNNTGANNVAVKDVNKITLGESTIGGDLSVTAIGDNMPGNERALGDFESGDIEQDNSGAGITVAGSSTFRVSDSRSIILNNPDNNFNSIAFELTGSTGILDSVILTNNSAIDLGNINLGGHLGLLANGGITNSSGVIQVAGTTWIEASDAGVFNQDPLTSGATQYFDVQLTNASNDFNDIVINAANNVDIVTLNNINFGDSANLQFSGEPLRDITTIFGNLTVTSTGDIGNITGMTLNVVGDAQFDATSGSVTLDEIVNLNSVAFNAQDVTLVEQDTIDLGVSNISNTASFTAQAGNISNSGDLEILGNALFTASDNSDILLSNILTGNRLQGDLSFVPVSGSLNSVNIENTRATSLEIVNSNNLVINSQGAISDTETATLRVNTVNLTAGNQDIILDGDDNDFNNLTVASAGELQFNDINSLVLESINANALVAITSENNLTLNGALNAGSGISLTANNGFVLLDNIVHTNAGDINISGNQLTQNANIEGDGPGQISLTANNGGITMAADTTSSGDSIAYTTINAGNNASAILANLTADNSININVADSLTQTGAFTSTAGDINIVAGSYAMDATTITQANAGSVTAEVEGLVDVQSIVANDDINLTSNTQSVQLNTALSSALGGVNVSAQQAITAVDIAAGTDINLSTANGNISQNGNFTSEQGVITLNSGQGINMAANTSANATLGDIQYNAVNDVIVTSLTANGVAGINTSAGEIIDANAEALNFMATTLSLRAANGIGSTERVESQVSIMDVENSTSGKVDIIQIGEVDLVALKNTGSDGDITLFTDMDVNFNPGSVVANRSNGDLFITTETGSFLGLGEGTLTNPDITAQNAVFFGRAGTFGSVERPLTLDVPGSVLIDTRTSYFPRFVPPGPESLDTRGIDFTIIGAVSAVAGEQLVEIESLGDIDPAIFTELHNYNQEDIAIRMPRDQLFEDELEEYDRQ